MNARKKLCEVYFEWLLLHVTETHDLCIYSRVCRIMHETPFLALVPHDENRVKDGTLLRDEFLNGRRRSYAEAEKIELLYPDASIFEVLVALIKRTNFIAGQYSEPQWFRIFLENLNLHDYPDTNISTRDEPRIEKILEKMNNRLYTRKGRGGLFPLNHSDNDQREVELWYQMSEYMTENKLY